MEQSSAIAAFNALGQPTRLAIFRLLLAAGAGGIAAGLLAAELDVKPNTLSTHLAILAAGGLVLSRRAGRSIVYSADIAGVQGLLRWLLQDCCGGRPEICAPILDQIGCAC